MFVGVTMPLKPGITAKVPGVMKALAEVAAGPFDVKEGQASNSTAHKIAPTLVA